MEDSRGDRTGTATDYADETETARSLRIGGEIHAPQPKKSLGCCMERRGAPVHENSTRRGTDPAVSSVQIRGIRAPARSPLVASRPRSPREASGRSIANAR